MGRVLTRSSDLLGTKGADLLVAGAYGHSRLNEWHLVDPSAIFPEFAASEAGSTSARSAF